MNYTTRKTDRYGRKTKSPKPKIGIHVVLWTVIVAGVATAFVLYGKLQEKTSPPGPLAEATERAADTGRPDRGDGPFADRGGRSTKSQPVPDEKPWPTLQFQSVQETSPTPEPPPTEPAKQETVDPAKQETVDPAQQKTIDPAKRETFRRAVADVRNSMADRDLVAGRDHLDKAALCSQTDEEKARVGRLEKMLEYLGLFWDGIGQAVRGLKGGEEFVVANTVAIVVEAGADYLVVRAQGMNRRYATHEIPHALVMVLADRQFADTSSSKVLMGTYLAVDRKGDRMRTRKLWEEAAEGGLNVTSLLSELEYSLGGGSGDSSGDASDAPSTGRNAAEETRELVRRRFQSDYDRATSLPKKAALAKKLFEAADTADDDVPIRLAMLREARDLAVAAGQASVACEAIEVLVELRSADWQIGDILLMKTEVLSEVSDNVRGPVGQKEVAQEALRLFENAVTLRRFDEARTLAPLAMEAAKKSKSLQLIQQATAAAERLATIKK